MDRCKEIISKLTNSNKVMFTRRGNKSIDFAVKFAKEKGFTKLLIPRDGGWMYYPKVAQKYKLGLEYLETKNAEIILSDLEKKLDSKTILLYHSLGGYFFKQDVSKIYSLAKEKNSFVIMDCSGSIGLSYVNKKYSDLCSAKFADFCVSSLRKNKPVNADGGFVCTNLDVDLGEDFDLDYQFLTFKLEQLSSRMNFLVGKSNEIFKELDNDYDIISSLDSLVVVVAFKDLKTKENIIKYCDTQHLEYTICPREIRVLCDAISIEVKRLEEEEIDNGVART